ncbi:hypothetical protein F2Q69_00002234 [Brassica cretica]|uniref:Uncharacterized protein n=1 Tax=Brassica cretica TaxID=69181 RepID=A0A8S9NVU5_BRACR|nr:hypothetical protein F2Q69_00002234 [Brassica cretica]
MFDHSLDGLSSATVARCFLFLIDLASQASLISLGREVLAFDQNHWSGGCHIFFNVPVDVNSMHCLEESNQDLQLPWSGCQFYALLGGKQPRFATSLEVGYCNQLEL